MQLFRFRETFLLESCISPLFLQQNSRLAECYGSATGPSCEFGSKTLSPSDILVTFSVRTAANLGFSRKCCSSTTFSTGCGKRKSRAVARNSRCISGAQGNPAERFGFVLQGKRNICKKYQRCDFTVFSNGFRNVFQKCHSVTWFWEVFLVLGSRCAFGLCFTKVFASFFRNVTRCNGI